MRAIAHGYQRMNGADLRRPGLGPVSEGNDIGPAKIALAWATSRCLPNLAGSGVAVRLASAAAVDEDRCLDSLPPIRAVPGAQVTDRSLSAE